MSKIPKPEYQKDEICFCFHGSVLYQAKVLEVDAKDEDNKKAGFKYKVHYKGWKATWDDWVYTDRMRKLTNENYELKAELDKQMLPAKKTSTASHKRKSDAAGTPGAGRNNSHRDSEDRSSVSGLTKAGTKRGREEIEKEEQFLNRPSIKLRIPDVLKSLLVDDWENITKSRALVPLPAAIPITRLLSDYAAHAAPTRASGSPEAALLPEVIAGILTYFNRALGRILLYRFERQQWLELHALMQMEPANVAKQSAKWKAEAVTRDGVDPAAVAGKTPADVYGAEHLCRLFVSLPELIAQTNMDQASVGKLKREIEACASWLGRNAKVYFAKEYEQAGPEYEAKAKHAG